MKRAPPDALHIQRSLFIDALLQASDQSRRSLLTHLGAFSIKQRFLKAFPLLHFKSGLGGPGVAGNKTFHVSGA